VTSLAIKNYKLVCFLLGKDVSQNGLVNVFRISIGGDENVHGNEEDRCGGATIPGVDGGG